jgi:multidrug efflux system membrane fusion protein
MSRIVLFTLLACSLATVTARADETPRPVRVATVAFSPAETAVTYPGTVQARIQASLGFRVAGQVTARMVDIGDHVTAGQILVRLDPTDAQLNLQASAATVRAADADAVNARADFQRYQRLGRNSPAFLPSEFDKRQAALDSAEARLAQAQRQLALAQDQLTYTTLRADADGVITGVSTQVGQVVSIGQTVFTLAHTAETEIVVDVPENRLPDIRTASTITIRLWSDPDHPLTGAVREIGALADPASRTFAVKVRLTDPPQAGIALGMTAAVRFARPGTSVATLPADAVVAVDGKPSVWVLNPISHRATARPVQVAAWQGDGQVAITAGIHNGDQVVTGGAALLDAATPVTAWAGAIR